MKCKMCGCEEFNDTRLFTAETENDRLYSENPFSSVDGKTLTGEIIAKTCANCRLPLMDGGEAHWIAKPLCATVSKRKGFRVTLEGRTNDLDLFNEKLNKLLINSELFSDITSIDFEHMNWE